MKVLFERKYLIIVIVGVVVAFVLGVLMTRKQNLRFSQFNPINKIVSQKIYTFENQLDGFEAGVIDDATMYNYLTSNGIVDGENTVQVNIKLVPQIDQPMFIQKTPGGDVIISAKIENFDKPNKEIIIAPNNYVFEQDNKGKWIDSRFHDAAELIIKRNQKTDSIRELAFENLFYLSKK